MMGEKGETKLPIHDSQKEMAQRFSDFFTTKIVTIRENLLALHADEETPTTIPGNETIFHGTPLSSFTEVSADEIRRFIMKSASKSCELDPVPTWLLKECIVDLVYIVTAIVNSSLKDAHVPSSMKRARVRPLLNKASLDPNVLKNYRPVSNLTFVSKILEKAVAAQLGKHLMDNQSAYRQYHSTETALLNVQTDLLSALHKGSVAVLLMLDLSAAFDTIDHNILLQRFENMFGITGDALAWFNGKKWRKVAKSGE